MTSSFEPRIGVLPAAQQRLWPLLRPAADLGFVLYGGTAVGLRLGHRPSVYFDFFSDEPLDRNAITAAMPFVAHATTLQDQGHTWVVMASAGDADHDHVKVSFFGTIGFGRVGEPDMTQDGVLKVASLDDLMATKVKVVPQRAEAKDYHDVAAMIRAGVSLPRGLAAARLLFGPNFQPSESLKALAYFDDGDLAALAAADKDTLVKAAKAVRDLPDVVLASKRLTGARGV
jgi:Nucleotidyl transferase AbiEii toxin, Type IV TA system